MKENTFHSFTAKTSVIFFSIDNNTSPQLQHIPVKSSRNGISNMITTEIKRKKMKYKGTDIEKILR